MQRDNQAHGLALEAADAYCSFLARQHYENFSVASLFVRGARRRDLRRIYAFCRTTDDLGDESPGETACARLARWRDEVEALFTGAPPVHPVLTALAETVAACRLPAQPFLDLIEANERDQRVKAYHDWTQLQEYCMLSAAPVGRMVLGVFGVASPQAQQLSDDVCVGLQLANHAQDVSRDAAMGRRYLVESDLQAGGVPGAVKAMVGRARALLESGRPLESQVPAALRVQLTLYRLGGQAICNAIERIGFQTERARPSVSAGTKVSLLVRAALVSSRR